MAMTCIMAMAQYKTAGDGKTYTFEALAGIAESGVGIWGGSEKSNYQLTQDITISEGDTFQLDDDVTVTFSESVTFIVEGTADFRVEHTTYFDSGDNGGAAIRISNGEGTTEFENCSFDKVGLESMSAGALHVSHCSFLNHDGSRAAALFFISAGQESTIEHCYFEECQKAAIGSAANASQSLVIRECQLVKNSRANNNIPQINLTAAQNIEITDCEVAGDPLDTEVNNMVGGIGISNFYGYADTHLKVSGCQIAWNRYGIGTVGPVADLRIENCTLTENNHEANPMNGGSGISLYDPYLQTCAVISGCHIEGSLWGVTIIGCQDVNLGQPTSSAVQSPGGNVFKDNGFDGQLYDLYNNSTLTVYAQNNTWNVAEQTEEEIEKVIFHKHDNPSLGEVIFWPASTTGISEVKSEKSVAAPAYDLHGLRHAVPQKGINIIHGKKVVY